MTLGEATVKEAKGYLGVGSEKGEVLTVARACTEEGQIASTQGSSPIKYKVTDQTKHLQQCVCGKSEAMVDSEQKTVLEPN
ncbi:hypothetical protein AALO_G00222110 [Alosa alosa]|uniref:Uncharacterized protein n=1 Tax=Alosa alosa TaxID=278164 RepID=A0AAV6FX77_9TELE|nr:hypothetical protein AALO_G00222110 [Alosa alosa]